MTSLDMHESCLSDLAIDRRLGALLPIDAERAVDLHLASCTRCSLRYELYQRQRDAFLAQAPDWETFDTQQQRGPARRRWLPWIAGAALAAVAALAFVAPQLGAPLYEVATGTRSKGAPSLGVYIQRGNIVTRGTSGDVVDAGDRVRFTYSSDRELSFALLHADDEGAEVYYPLTNTSLRVPARRDAALDFAIELDAHVGDERYFGVFCDEALTLEPVRAALQHNGELPDLPDCHVDTIRLQKRPR